MSDTDVKKILSFQSPEIITEFNFERPVLYALGLGYNNTGPGQEQELEFTYEGGEDFKIVPTFGSVMVKIDILDLLNEVPGMPEFSPMMLLHGEQTTELIQPLKPDTKYSTVCKVADVADKGKSMLLTFEVLSKEKETGNPVVRNLLSLFIRGAGGFGYKGKGATNVSIPKTKPDLVYEEKTEVNQAIIYRLSGDFNPLHIDKNMSSMGGFDVPILHGMCSYGLSCKTIVSQFCNYKVEQFKSIWSRFVGHVFPGETIVFNFWKSGNELVFVGQVKERGTKCIIGKAEINPQSKL